MRCIFQGIVNQRLVWEGENKISSLELPVWGLRLKEKSTQITKRNCESMVVISSQAELKKKQISLQWEAVVIYTVWESFYFPRY